MKQYIQGIIALIVVIIFTTAIITMTVCNKTPETTPTLKQDTIIIKTDSLKLNKKNKLGAPDTV